MLFAKFFSITSISTTRIVRQMTFFARFADERRKITQNSAKPKLFEPNKSGNLSIFDLTNRTDQQVCELGVKYVAKPKGRRLYGWGKLSYLQIKQVGLQINKDDHPPGHANIIGWPDAVEDRKSKSQKLAKASKVKKLSTPAEKCMDCSDRSDFPSS